MPEQDVDRLQKVLNELGEHYDTVHIFLTRHEASEGKTYEWQKGIGNWLARYGQISLWVEARKREDAEPSGD